jgi:hypothetical protein
VIDEKEIIAGSPTVLRRHVTDTTNGQLDCLALYEHSLRYEAEGPQTTSVIVTELDNVFATGANDALLVEYLREAHARWAAAGPNPVAHTVPGNVVPGGCARSRPVTDVELKDVEERENCHWLQALVVETQNELYGLAHVTLQIPEDGLNQPLAAMHSVQRP